MSDIKKVQVEVNQNRYLAMKQKQQQQQQLQQLLQQQQQLLQPQIQMDQQIQMESEQQKLARRQRGEQIRMRVLHQVEEENHNQISNDQNIMDINDSNDVRMQHEEQKEEEIEEEFENMGTIISRDQLTKHLQKNNDIFSKDGGSKNKNNIFADFFDNLQVGQFSGQKYDPNIKREQTLSNYSVEQLFKPQQSFTGIEIQQQPQQDNQQQQQNSRVLYFGMSEQQQNIGQNSFAPVSQHQDDHFRQTFHITEKREQTMGFDIEVDNTQNLFKSKRTDSDNLLAELFPNRQQNANTTQVQQIEFYSQINPNTIFVPPQQYQQKISYLTQQENLTLKYAGSQQQQVRIMENNDLQMQFAPKSQNSRSQMDINLDYFSEPPQQQSQQSNIFGF